MIASELHPCLPETHEENGSSFLAGCHPPAPYPPKPCECKPTKTALCFDKIDRMPVHPSRSVICGHHLALEIKPQDFDRRYVITEEIKNPTPIAPVKMLAMMKTPKPVGNIKRKRRPPNPTTVQITPLRTEPRISSIKAG